MKVRVLMLWLVSMLSMLSHNLVPHHHDLPSHHRHDEISHAPHEHKPSGRAEWSHQHDHAHLHAHANESDGQAPRAQRWMPDAVAALPAEIAPVLFPEVASVRPSAHPFVPFATGPPRDLIARGPPVPVAVRA